jgi:DNA adenine methylase
MTNIDLAEPTRLGRATRVGVPPVLRWAGGKRWLAPSIVDAIRRTKSARVVEPFLGGAAIYLATESHLTGVLNDTNVDLIRTYRAIRTNADEIAVGLSELENSPATYYHVRARFHLSTDGQDEVARAVDFIYLNHHSFNGIYRVNKAGAYNVPFGHRKRVAVPTSEHLNAAAAKLRRAELHSGDFETSVERAGDGDFIFADPPYTVAHNNNGFVKYNQKLFTFEDQERLADTIARASSRGANIVVTNANHESIRRLYRDFAMRPVRTKSTVGGTNASRAASSELIISNFEVALQ